MPPPRRFTAGGPPGAREAAATATASAPSRAGTARRAGQKLVTAPSGRSPAAADGSDDAGASAQFALGLPLLAGLLGVLSVVGGPGTPLGGVWEALQAHYGSAMEEAFLVSVVAITGYCLAEMFQMQMKCPHWEARLHILCNTLAIFCSLYGIGLERVYRESPDLWWAVLTPVLYTISNFTMTRLMNMYSGPTAYKRLFDLGQSFTLSFQGIHLLAWSSVYPWLFWAAMPFWYWSIKKLVEPVIYMLGVMSGEDAGRVSEHRDRDESWGAFGLEMDAGTIAFMALNFAAALADNAYMGTYTIRGPEGFFEVSRSLADTAGWGSDHLRMALVKPAVGSLIISVAVFVGTLCSRGKMPLAVGVPISAVLSALGPWFVFFWHRAVDPSEPWLPELMGDNWGPGPLAQLLGISS